MSPSSAVPATLRDLGKELGRYRDSLHGSARAGLQFQARKGKLLLSVARISGIRVRSDSKRASLTGKRLPVLAIDVSRFDVRTGADPIATRLVFSTSKKERSVGNELSERVQEFFNSTALANLHAAALREALKASNGLDALLRVLERPEIAASLRDQDPLALARLRGIAAKQRILTADGGTLGAKKVGEILTISRQAVEKRRKAGRLIGISLGRRGYGYPAWQFAERGTLPHLESILDALKQHSDWAKQAFFVSQNAALAATRPLDLLRSGDSEAVLGAARIYGEQGAASSGFRIGIGRSDPTTPASTSRATKGRAGTLPR